MGRPAPEFDPVVAVVDAFRATPDVCAAIAVTSVWVIPSETVVKVVRLEPPLLVGTADDSPEVCVESPNLRPPEPDGLEIPVTSD